MKKGVILIISVLCLGLLLGCGERVACGNGIEPVVASVMPSEANVPPVENLTVPPDEITCVIPGEVRCRIIAGAGEGDLLLAEDGEYGAVFRLKISDKLDEYGVALYTGAVTLQNGMMVLVRYGGGIFETFPSQFDSPIDITVLDESINDTAGLCLQVFDDLRKDHMGLYKDAKYLGVNLSSLEGLTDSERLAVAWYLGEKSGLEMIQGTFDQLAEQGYIDDKNLCWKDGVFFSMEGTAEKFDAEKWRAGDAGYYLKDCVYTEKEGVWSYSSGSFAVS